MDRAWLPSWMKWFRALAEHARNSGLTRPQLLELQRRKFRRLVRHAASRSPYYAGIVRERRIDVESCRVEDFPVLRKADVVERFDEIVTVPNIDRRSVGDFLRRSSDPRDVLHGRYHVVHSSGSSGTTAIYVYDHDEWIQGCSLFMRSSPLRKLRRRVAFVGATRGHFAGVSMMLNGTTGLNRLFFDIALVDVGDPFEKIVADLNRFRPDTLAGYATTVKCLAQAQRDGRLKIKPDEVGIGSETIRSEDRHFIEAVFGVRVLNVYSTCECLHMGMPLTDDDSMYLMEDEMIFELHEDYTCVTNLFNWTMPLIRYRFDDVLQPADEGESPLPFQRVKNVVGRLEATLEFIRPDGSSESLHPALVETFYAPGIVTWQVEQRAVDAIEFRAVYEDGLAAENRRQVAAAVARKIAKVLRAKKLEHVRFELREVAELNPDPRTGKFRIIIPLGERTVSVSS